MFGYCFRQRRKTSAVKKQSKHPRYISSRYFPVLTTQSPLTHIPHVKTVHICLELYLLHIFTLLFRSKVHAFFHFYTIFLCFCFSLSSKASVLIVYVLFSYQGSLFVCLSPLIVCLTYMCNRIFVFH